MKQKRSGARRPGKPWRVLAYDVVTKKSHSMESKGEFDELVVGDPVWIHLEQMDTREWWMQLGEHYVWITIPADGSAPIVSVNHEILSTDRPEYPWMGQRRRRR